MITKKTTYEDGIVVHELTKTYGKLLAVDKISFGIHKQEIFGLLGVNGAGKTTTFRMLTGDLRPTFGNSYIGNKSLVKDLNDYTKKLGYCPQFNALIDSMTGKEMMLLMARLRGLKPSCISQTISNLINVSGLGKHANNLTVNYSGGNKRKLALALAILNSPEVIFLDEPTSGVDPISRRKIWGLLNSVHSSSESSIVLTSHSMDECEYLCDRIAIMVKGKIRCLGPTQYLRSKYGEGYTLTLKVKNDNLETNKCHLEEVKQEMRTILPNSMLKDEHQRVLLYHIPHNNNQLNWSSLFSISNKLKSQFDLEDYQLSDTTLEEIFLNIARLNI